MFTRATILLQRPHSSTTHWILHSVYFVAVMLHYEYLPEWCTYSAVLMLHYEYLPEWCTYSAVLMLHYEYPPEWCTYSAVLMLLLDECPFRCNLLTKSQKIKTMYLNTSMWCVHHFSHKAFAIYVKNITPQQTICRAHNYWGVLFCRLFQWPTVCG